MALPIHMVPTDAFETCRICTRPLDDCEYDVCGQCADDEDAALFEEFMQDRFDMETESEWKERKENRW